eukprot:c7141_g1_i1.p1 GENE.c7141_g1_i1~~c7141_g1_i1.p1  ORF type:complete len:224 (+),score=58.43 c7141_g1_i1:39-674(+)
MSHLATFIFVFIFAWGAGKQHTANAVIINNQEVDLAITDTVYFDIAIDSQPRGRIVMGLYGNALPSAVKNFRVLCSGILGYGYKGTPIHSVVQDIFLAGGVMGHTSEGKQYGRSIYNEAIQFENVVIPFDSPGQVVMSIDKYRRGDSKFGISSSKENVPQVGEKTLSDAFFWSVSNLLFAIEFAGSDWTSGNIAACDWRSVGGHGHCLGNQ